MGFPAAYFKKLDSRSVRCRLCPHNCTIEPSKTGDCLTRKNEDGELQVVTYGILSAAAEDPIEKKPLFHFNPGSTTFSIASKGCNLVCPFCQNHGLSQAFRCQDTPGRTGNYLDPKEVVQATLQTGCSSISFTYSEPILQFEFARDVASIAKPEGLGIVFVTNGQAGRDPALEMAGFVDGANVDLKCFDKNKYKTVLDGSLSATTGMIETLASSGVWVEVTTLVIPEFNDSDEELKKIAGFIKNLGSHIPWHVSRFHPDYKWLHVPATTRETLTRAREIGLAEGLQQVYVGNLPGDEGEKTRCPACESVVIDRRGYHIVNQATKDGGCAACGEPVAGVGIR